MSLLTKATRKSYFKYLGLGEYNKANILKFQKIAFKDKKEHDGIYGSKTDIALRHWHHTKLYAGKNFQPEEFKCPCGKCTGYPTWMRAKTLKHAQAIRDHFGKPMTITSGLRCQAYNDSLPGADKKYSKHMTGYAIDFYMKGVSDTLTNRRNSIAFIKKMKNHDFTYGDRVSSTGLTPICPTMGNALHTQVK